MCVRACVRASMTSCRAGRTIKQDGKFVLVPTIVRGFAIARRSLVDRAAYVTVGKKILFIDAWSVVDGQARTRETLIRRESNVTIDTRHLLPARCSPLCVTRIYRPPSHTIKGKNGKFFTNIVNNDRTLVVPRMQRDRIASLFSSFLRIRSSIDSQLPVSSIVNGGESISR